MVYTADYYSDSEYYAAYENDQLGSMPEVENTTRFVATSISSTTPRVENTTTLSGTSSSTKGGGKGRKRRSILAETDDPDIRNKTISYLLDRMGWTLSRTTIFANRFRKQQLPASFFKQVQTEIGNCAVFESNPVISQQMAGSRNGLEVFINIEHTIFKQ